MTTGQILKICSSKEEGMNASKQNSLLLIVHFDFSKTIQAYKFPALRFTF